MLQGFKDFVMRGNVLDLAVAVVIGAAFSGVIQGLVDGFIMPLIGWLVGAPDFTGIAFSVPNWQGTSTEFPIGVFIQSLIMFVLIAGAIYFFVMLPINKLKALRKSSEEVVEEAAAEEVVLLTEIRDLLRVQSDAQSPSQPS
ncbi:large conductance mechanosensitive channel protein MscL [Promicromonospora iranensis]|uniref:Large-conductance mechanosensitive channel n=1 Tax=Promicromonospora iranensis TaxID=1105144 RepID=A0ABU2CR89_9MICO|nr:large conductance mechanosensitive channel protein MscL [Promicromonospora iranensis]MDR7383863.1 large conductance mechanosensitive channel [Promicromonospora iranensis]